MGRILDCCSLYETRFAACPTIVGVMLFKGLPKRKLVTFRIDNAEFTQAPRLTHRFPLEVRSILK